MSADPTASQLRARLDAGIDVAVDGRTNAPRTGARTDARQPTSTAPAAAGSPRRRPFSVGAAPASTPAAANAPAANAAEAPSLTKSTSGTTTVVEGSGADDSIQVSPRAGGGVVIQNGTDRLELTAAEARDLEINALGGDDRVYVDPSISYDIRINGGDGDDTLTGGGGDDTIDGGNGRDTVLGADGDDLLRGGEGNDVLDGGAGGDYVNGQDGDDAILGGAGRDVLYGLEGDDAISGGEGRDYIDGGIGADRLMGGDGIDQVFGGRGDDDLRGGEGDDVLAGGEGTDAYDGDGGADTVFHQDGEWIARDVDDTRTEVDMSGAEPGTAITIDPSSTDAFTDRVESDLDALRSIPSGRSMLEALDASGRTTTVEETSRGNSASFLRSAYMTGNNSTPGTPSDTTVRYNPEVIDIGRDVWNDRPPIVGLYHELVHAENAQTGTMPTGTDAVTGDPNLEHIAVGLDIDHDGDPSTPRIQPNANNENRFRDELNLEPRLDY